MFQKESALALWYRARTSDSRRGTRKTMIVALARKLVIALWRFVTTGEPIGGRRLTSSVLNSAPFGARSAFSTTAELRSEVAGSRIRTWHLMPTDRMGPLPGASPPMRMTASRSGSKRSYRIQVCDTKIRPMASSPRIILNRSTGTDQTPRYAKSPSRSSSSLRVLRRQGAAKHKQS
jgi:transposase